MIPEQLKHVRKKIFKLNQTELADRLGMGRQSVARMEAGTQPIEKRTELALRWIAWSEHQVTWSEEQRELDI